MNVTRQDAWSAEEDTLLAETVLRYIRDGKTQLEAFKEVGKRVSRTPAACGFRWNASVRKQYQEAIDLAKKERKKIPQQLMADFTRPNNSYSLETAISILENMKGNYHFLNSQELNRTDQLERALEENERLKQKLAKYQTVLKEVEQVNQLIKQLKE
ncbi:hypothetical protein Pryu01_00025 [Paraliobacillus ryukyuensis]|uniref:RsfA family transcription factor n=1 Tax=Paraliobacillus ryukyuensis TaxID=200904 RepID=A0A366EHT1_9BACI|nr:RsfA family transcriptional regulator [Paraliobacillus ryukyuensis]RBP01903.1 RsfA family transcription factor [Paraliobacillus ryukyuensis]